MRLPSRKARSWFRLRREKARLALWRSRRRFNLRGFPSSSFRRARISIFTYRLGPMQTLGLPQAHSASSKHGDSNPSSSADVSLVQLDGYRDSIFAEVRRLCGSVLDSAVTQPDNVRSESAKSFVVRHNYNSAMLF